MTDQEVKVADKPQGPGLDRMMPICKVNYDFGDANWSMRLGDIVTLVQVAITASISTPLPERSKWRLGRIIFQLSAIAGFGLSIGVMCAILLNKGLGAIIELIWGAYL